MQTEDKEDFAAALDEAWQCYGKSPDKETLRRHWARLKQFPLSAVKNALFDVPVRFPKYPPNVGFVVDIARAKAVEVKRRFDEEEREAREVEENRQLWESYHETPTGTEAIEYIQDTECPWEALARRWECESKAGGIDPTQPSPKSLYDERRASFWRQWETEKGQGNADNQS